MTDLIHIAIDIRDKIEKAEKIFLLCSLYGEGEKGGGMGIEIDKFAANALMDNLNYAIKHFEFKAPHEYIANYDIESKTLFIYCYSDILNIE